MKGIGCDIIEVDRIAQVLERHGPAFLAKTFTQSEQDYCLKRKPPERHFAGRFAAKEAIAKALGCGFGSKLAFLDIEILNDPEGKPVAHLTPEAAARHNYPILHLSLSHTQAYATAFAVCT